MGVGGFFGGGNESKTTNRYDIDEERAESAGQLNLEPGDVDEGGSVNTSAIQGVSASGKSKINVQTSDLGAIDKAFKFAGTALNKTAKTADAAAKQASQQAQTAVDAVRDTVSEQNETQNVIRGIAVVGGIIGITFIALNWRKG